MAAKSNEFEKEMARLEAAIKRLEVEYNMFFVGRLPRLPWETRAQVEKLVKHYDRMHLRNTAERFRFGVLQSKFVAFCDLWERQLKAKEGGRPPRGRGAAAALPEGSQPDAGQPEVPPPEAPVEAPSPRAQSPAAPRAAAPRAAPPSSSAQASAKSRAVRTKTEKRDVDLGIRDPSKEPDRLKQLYDRLSAARKAAGEQPLPYDSFAKVVQAQVKKLGGGSSEVAFRVAVDQGKVTLTATKKTD
jgi:hypothetical protein